MNEKKFNLYKIFNSIAIFGLFIVVTLAVLQSSKTIAVSKVVNELIWIIGALCFFCLIAMPWAKRLDNKENKILSIVFLSLTGVCAILWIISIILVFSFIKNNPDEAQISRVLNFIKVNVFITIQFFVALSITTSILKFKNTMVPFQAIYYLSMVYLDFYASFALFCLKISSSLEFSINNNLEFLKSRFMIVSGSLALVYVAVSAGIIKAREKRKMKDLANSQKIGAINEVKVEKVDSDEEIKLSKLKEMYDNHLITEDEYKSKKDEILKNF
jgi:hypothetical protein